MNYEERVKRPRQVMIYGPPAAGKLTVATTLAGRYGLRVLDNHASIDPALRLFNFGTPAFAELVEELRVILIRAAARAGIDIVTTLVYGHGIDDEHVNRLSCATAESGGSVHYVQLRPANHVLEQRVLAESRATTSKIKDLRLLHASLERFDLTTPIHDDDLRIDNSELMPDVVADMIGKHLSLDPSFDLAHGRSGCAAAVRDGSVQRVDRARPRAVRDPRGRG